MNDIESFTEAAMNVAKFDVGNNSDKSSIKHSKWIFQDHTQSKRDTFIQHSGFSNDRLSSRRNKLTRN